MMSLQRSFVRRDKDVAISKTRQSRRRHNEVERLTKSETRQSRIKFYKRVLQRSYTIKV